MSSSSTIISAGWERLAAVGVSDEVLQLLKSQYEGVAPRLADPTMAMHNLERVFESVPNPLSLAVSFGSDPEALPNLLQLLASSQYLADRIASDPEIYHQAHRSQGRPVSRETLTKELVDEVAQLDDWRDAAAALRRFKVRQTARIAYGDLIRDQSVAAVTQQVSHVADAVLEAALVFLTPRCDERFGVPLLRDGTRARFCVLAMGKLGGLELNYSSDIDLVFVYEADGSTDHRRATTNQECFERLAQDLVKLVGETTDQGACYRVDTRLRPEGASGRLTRPIDAMVAYYDTRGRTWERQAYVKARPAAGDLALGKKLLDELKLWVYRRYLSLADIAGIKALKRRIERRTLEQGENERNVKTGRGGIRDIEFVIQFLQLLNGGSLPAVRTGNTLEAIERLERAGCLTPQEGACLTENYGFLRRLEHRLQLVFDRQTHTLPEDAEELGKIAARMGYADAPEVSALDAFRSDLASTTDVNRRILDHLLHDAFDDEPGDADPAVDLVNNPDPTPDEIAAALGQYPFDNHQAAYTNLMSLAQEPIRFLSSQRCRHFLAPIASRLLTAVSAAPEPDATLVRLSRVSDSLGGKAALWELLQSNDTALRLYVTLCAACPYLTDILTSNPGMIDELMDSLLIARLPSPERLTLELAELTRGAEDLDPILHSFKHAHHLRIGVRDLLGWDDVRATHRSLADVAEACLGAIGSQAYAGLLDKFGAPTIGAIDTPDDDSSPAAIEEYRSLRGREGQPASLVILAMGKLGGREPNYHSDLDLVFLYEADGSTVHSRRSRRVLPTSNSHFFSELGQRVITAANRLTQHGRLYEVDARLRPTGSGGSLAVSVRAFREYFASGSGRLWERLALCKARAVHGTPEARKRVMAAVEAVAYHPEWRSEHAAEIREMRRRLEATASPHNLKRGPGGTIDTEFLVQMLQLKHGGEDRSVREPGTLAALAALQAAGHLADDDADFFRNSYLLQRSIESRIRLMNSAGRHEFPDDEVDLQKLALLLGAPDGAALATEVEVCRRETRERFERFF